MSSSQPNSPSNRAQISEDTPGNGKAQSIADRSRDAARQQADAAKQKARATGEQLKDRSSGALHDLRETGEQYVAARKESVADRIQRYGREIDDAAQSFEADDPNIAWFTHRVADRINHFADHVRGSDFRTLWDEAEDVARRHPAAVVGGLFAAGLAVGSFVRAARADEDEDWDESTDAGMHGGEGLVPGEGAPVASSDTVVHTTQQTR